jgi:hypothetical protein
MQPERSSPGASNLPSEQPPLTMDRLNAMINLLYTQLVATQWELSTTQSKLLTAQQQATHGGGSGGPKRNKPPTFDGKGSVDFWLQHLNEYYAGVVDSKKLAIAVTHLSRSAHEWYIGTKILGNSPVHDYTGFCSATSKRSNPIDKTRAARDKLAKWRQLRTFQIYSQYFVKIILDLSSLTEDEKIDR